MKRIFLVLVAMVFCLGCAKVSVQGSKEPIKVDISMRLDVYQHVQNDINAIEDIVGGAPQEQKTDDQQSWMDIFIGPAYAQEDLSPEIQQAALRRKDRLTELHAQESQGVVGEDKSGLVQLRDASQAGTPVEALIAAENIDRLVIYKGIAAKNNTPVEEIQKVYAQRLQADAPAGTPIEVSNPATGAYEWKKK